MSVGRKTRFNVDWLIPVNGLSYIINSNHWHIWILPADGVWVLDHDSRELVDVQSGAEGLTESSDVGVPGGCIETALPVTLSLLAFGKHTSIFSHKKQCKSKCWKTVLTTSNA